MKARKYQPIVRKPVELVFTPEGLRRVMKEAIERRTTKIHEYKHSSNPGIGTAPGS